MEEIQRRIDNLSEQRSKLQNLKSNLSSKEAFDEEDAKFIDKWIGLNDSRTDELNEKMNIYKSEVMELKNLLQMRRSTLDEFRNTIESMPKDFVRFFAQKQKKLEKDLVEMKDSLLNGEKGKKRKRKKKKE